jgi:glycerol-3-phosphate dehydrogenase (NAD(P)+)
MTRATVAVLGAGSWGTALAALLCGNGVATRLWGRNADALARIASSHRNPRYLPDLTLPAELVCVPDLAEALRGVDLALVAVPSHAFGQVLDEAAPLLPPTAGYAWATKGFEPGTGRFLHELVAERLPGTPAAVVTGPSFAREVAAGMPTAVTVHSDDDAFAHRDAELLHSHTFRAYTGSDILGAELGGAMKNVLAVATGVADGMRLGLNARAGLITRGMNEMLRLGAALGAKPQTLMGLAGLGDLVLTCTGDLSRNHRFGFALGRGVPLEQALADIGQVVEGAVTADEVMRLAARHGLDTCRPYCAGK